MSEESISSETSVDASTLIASAIDRYLRLRAAGEAVSDESFLAEHPDLMPQLGEELRKLRLIWEAQEKAAKSSSGVGSARGLVGDAPVGSHLSTANSQLDESATVPRFHSETPSKPKRPLPNLRQIGPYRVIRVLGEGGCGVVYLAKDLDLDRPVAIKIAKPDADRSSDEDSTFIDEARRVAQLKHPSIVNVLDVSRGEADAWYLVMEYIDGPSLANVFAEDQLSTVAMVDLLIQIAEAIHYAHSNGILHRDLKPSNVLLDKSQRRAHIVDFGIALHEREQYSAPRRPAGTPYCMAPEQVRGETHRLDARTDIWSLGVMMYQGLTGKRPFGGENVGELFQNILDCDPRPLAHVNPCVPTELERICLKCLSKRMADRYPTAADMAIDLKGWLADHSQPTAAAASVPEADPAAPDAAANAEIVPKGLRSFGSEDAAFFLELLPGPRNRDGMPESVHAWLKSVENRERQPERSVLVLYGPTGSGKSSFVSAGILPRVSASTSLVWGDAAKADLPKDILSKLHRVCPELPARVDLPRACDLIRRGQGPQANRKVLVVLDQFEQWLHANNRCLSGPLATALRHCDGVRLQCLIIVRSDFWLGITRFMQELEIPLVEGLNSAHLDLFDARHARKVLTLFGQSYGCLPKDGSLDSESEQFLDQAMHPISKDGWVTPVRLALLADMLRGQDWNSSTLARLGGERGLGVAFLEQSFGSSLAAPRHRRYRRAAEAVLRALLPEPGVDIKGRSRTEAELIEACGYQEKPEQFAELLEILDSQLRLITPTEINMPIAESTDHAESSVDFSAYHPSYQLTHDYLIPALREWLSRGQQSTRSGRAQICLEERDKQWQREQSARSLPSLTETVRIGTLTDRKNWTASQESMMKKAAGLQLKRVGIWVATVAALSAAILVMIPPDPLRTFLDPTQPSAARIAAFDRLGATGETALRPVLAAINREPPGDVLKHATASLPAICARMKLSDEERAKVAADLVEYLRRERNSPGSLRPIFFQICAHFSTPHEIVALAVDIMDQNDDSISPLLKDYIRGLKGEELFASGGPPGRSQAGKDPNELVSKLVRLIELLPQRDAGEAAAGLLAGLPTPRLVDLFVSAFAADSSTGADESTSIYVRGLPAGRRAAEANHLIDEFTRRLEGLISAETKEKAVRGELKYALKSIENLQSFTESRNEEAVTQSRRIIDRRDEFRDGAVPLAACRAYAAMYRVSQNRDTSPDPAQLAPLVGILESKREPSDLRSAVATSLGDTGEQAMIKPLVAIAHAPTEELGLRIAAVGALANIGRTNAQQKEITDEVAGALLALLDIKRYESDGFFSDVAHDYADFTRLEDLPRILPLLSLPVHNFAAQRCIYTFLLRIPNAAEKIATDTLVMASSLTPEEKQTLFPGTESILSEMSQAYGKSKLSEVEIALRALAPALARIATGHADASVRVLAGQNLRRVVRQVKGMPAIDPEAPDHIRREQFGEWEKAWVRALPTLSLNEETQLIGPAVERP